MQVAVRGHVWPVGDGATICCAGWAGIHGNAKDAKPAPIFVHASEFLRTKLCDPRGRVSVST